MERILMVRLQKRYLHRVVARMRTLIVSNVVGNQYGKEKS